MPHLSAYARDPSLAKRSGHGTALGSASRQKTSNAESRSCGTEHQTAESLLCIGRWMLGVERWAFSQIILALGTTNASTRAKAAAERKGDRAACVRDVPPPFGRASPSARE